MVSKPESPRRTDRARSSEDKLSRRQDILNTALELWKDFDYDAIPMSEVAARAGLAKGTLYLYFPTKEELFLALLSDLLENWFSSVAAALEGVPDSTVLADVLVSSLEGRDHMVSLLALLSSVLEQNSSQAAVLEFKTRLAEASAALAPRLESLLALGLGEGVRFLLHFNALAIGLYQMSRPVPGVSDAPEFASLHVDFALELRVALGRWLEGRSTTGD